MTHPLAPWHTDADAIKELYAWLKARDLTHLGPITFSAAARARPDAYSALYFQMKVEEVHCG